MIPAPPVLQHGFSTVHIRSVPGSGDSVRSLPPIHCSRSYPRLEPTIPVAFCPDSSLMHTARQNRTPSKFNLGTIPERGFDPRTSQPPTTNNILRFKRSDLEEGADGGCTTRDASETAVAGAGRRAARAAALVAHAPGRALLAGVPEATRQGARFCGVLPDPGAGRRGDVAAGPTVWHGCGDPVR